MQTRVVILGAGFGGLELATTLSEALGDDDRRDADRQERRVRIRLREARRDVRPHGARGRAHAVPRHREARRPLPARRPSPRSTPMRAGSRPTPAVHEADVLVIALGADYDMDATPGLAEGGNEFYSVAGAEHPGETCCRRSRSGRAIVGVCGAPFKCPPAPSECALMLHDYLSARGVREDCDICARDAARDACAALARHLARPARCVRRARHRVRRRGRRVSSLDSGAQAWRCSTTAASCRSTSSSACRSIGRRTS